MIMLRNARTIDGKTTTVALESREDRDIDATGLTLMPALIDAHVHFRTPGLEHKEDWKTAAKAALHGGITTVFDMPNTIPPATTLQVLLQKKEIIDRQLKEVGIPLHYGLYLGADKHHFDEIAKAKDHIIGVKVFMGASTGGLVMDDDESLHTVFKLAASLDLVVAVHAEDEKLIHEKTILYQDQKDPKVHSLIRSREGASLATKKAIDLARTYKTRLFILHVGTKEEVKLIQAAKEEGLSVFAETTPHHLFLNEESYETLGTKVQMNPPLRKKEDNLALWQGLRNGVIDTIGSDHAPHTLKEKDQPYGKAPSGIPGVETTLSLLLDAFHKGIFSLDQIIRCMKTNVEKIFRLPSNQDVILVDLNKTKKIEAAHLQTKCRWSPYEGTNLQGWPVYVFLKGKTYDVR